MKKVNVTKRVKQTNIVMISILCLSILFFSLIDIDKLDSLVIYNDEFGYWAAAAYFAGLDWTELMSTVQYYSFGYSFLLLPILLIANNSLIAYKCAVIINGMLLVISFFIAIFVINKIFPEINRLFIVITCFFVTIFPVNIIYAHYTLSETLLYTMFWIIILCLVLLTEKITFLRLAGMGLSLIYLYVVHQRTIGILLSATIILLLFFIKNNISLKKIVFFLIFVVIIWGMYAVIKKGLIDTYYANSQILGYTDYSGQGEKIRILLTLNGLKVFILNLLGRLWYIFLSSYGMAYWGVLFIIRTVVSCLKKMFHKSSEITSKEWIVLFVGLGFVSMLLVSALTMIVPLRVDHLIYGRYTDFLMAVITLFGIIELAKKRNPNILFFLFIVICCLLSVCTDNYVKEWIETGDDFTNIIAPLGVLSLTPYLSDGELIYTENLIYKMFLVKIFWSTILMVLLNQKVKWKKININFCLVVMITAILLMQNIIISLQGTVLVDQAEKSENTLAITEYINALEQEPEIYFVMGNQYMESIQFFYPYKTIESIEISDLLDAHDILGDTGILIEKKASGNIEILEEKFNIIFETELLCVFVERDSVYIN